MRDAACSTSSTSGRRPSAAASASVDSTITRTSGSVPDGRTSTRPSSPSSSSTSRTRLQNAASLRSGVGAVDRDVAQDLRHAVSTDVSSDSDRPRRAMVSRRNDAGEDAVAGGGVVGEDHVARLLAAEREVALLERVEHVAVADRGLDHGDAVGLERAA